MKTIPVHDAKTNLSKYIAAAKRGERVLIGRYGKAEVMLKPLPHSAGGRKRVFGLAKGKIIVAPDAFAPETDKLIAESLLKDDQLFHSHRHASSGVDAK